MTMRYILTAVAVACLSTAGAVVVYAQQSSACEQYQDSERQQANTFAEQQTAQGRLLAACLKERDDSRP